jgi:hypothetical protein
MSDDRDARVDFAGLLAALSFLLADFSGRALVRLGHAGSDAAGRIQGRETAERVPFGGNPARARAR